ncbi:CMD domain protein [Bradyrhizobium sp. 180]|uniref:CMD domain protein n=1 Tax=unclassified Bradyrhizobium TaxID=2631580 RepID=UPI001FFA5074|nr:MULTISPECIES: CMD domain protein [unclassified Bradyrhizobium]MCK1421867.1 CMD domain protein [Bradyrhizobium sp. CW12]MCK1492487.1 CMD domain protein [Bradyrhizobium sp. 180]MCK1528616.1 CMD domain protein [Bradyrhizobium sp. 182]MCK1598304.1 CMD domain protein [Bradyrhizobium sp. 164]MCK1648459.1 CMD domain protein [Bradyrhizobium sp. 154]
MGTQDIIDTLAGIEPESALDAIRARRLQARENAQKSYLALFEPIDASAFSLAERAAVAAFVTGLHGESPVAAFYREKLAANADGAPLLDAIKAEIERGKTSGPYGAYPAGPLSVENTAGLIYRVSAEGKPVLGARLVAALEHAHLLVFRPRDAASADMKALLVAGWSNTGIVTFSQLVAFLSFQVRVVTGLRVLGASLGPTAAGA